MPAQDSQDNNYKKDINFLDQELVQNIKASVQVPDVKKKPDLKFKSGAKPRFNLDINLSQTKKPTLSLEDDKPAMPKPPIQDESTFAKATADKEDHPSKFHPPAPMPPNKPLGKILEEQKVDNFGSNKASDNSNIDLLGSQSKSDNLEKPEKNSHNFPSLKDLVRGDDNDKKDKSLDDNKEGFDVNLIPTELRSAESFMKAIKKISIYAGVSILFVVVVFVSLNLFGSSNKKKIDDIKSQVKTYEEEIQKARDTIGKLSSFTDQTKKVGEILEGREIWSVLFDMLEADTIPEVYYVSVSVSSDDKVVLQTIGRSYHDIARQYKIFEANPNISDLDMSSASLDTALWEDYVNLAKLENERLAELDQLTTSTQFNLDPETLKSLLTVESTISFRYVINPTSTVLDKYE